MTVLLRGILLLAALQGEARGLRSDAQVWNPPVSILSPESSKRTSVLSPQSSEPSHEFGIQVVGTSGKPAVLVAGPAWAWRPGLRDRLVLFGGVGAAEHQIAFRGEAVWQFRLEPTAEHGVGVYLGGGLAAQAAESTHGFVIAAAGIESSPARGRGWLVELGVGGGVRLVLGWRWR